MCSSRHYTLSRSVTARQSCGFWTKYYRLCIKDCVLHVRHIITHSRFVQSLHCTWVMAPFNILPFAAILFSKTDRTNIIDVYNTPLCNIEHFYQTLTLIPTGGQLGPSRILAVSRASGHASRWLEYGEIGTPCAGCSGTGGRPLGSVLQRNTIRICLTSLDSTIQKV